MRENIFDLISGNEIDLLEEYRRLYILFEKTQLFCASSFLNLIEANFMEWEYRERFLSAKEMMEKIQINQKSMISNITTNKLLLYIEFIYNTLAFQNANISIDNDRKKLFALINNMTSILNDLNYDIEKQKNGKYIITEKNPLTSCIAETKPDIANIVIEYRRFSLKGNIDAKRDILIKLGDKIEPLRKKFKGTNYKNFVEDINMLLNNLNIRHNNMEGPKKKEYTINMEKEELEKWYDKTYDMILGAFIIEEYIDNDGKITELKSHYKSC